MSSRVNNGIDEKSDNRGKRSTLGRVAGAFFGAIHDIVTCPPDDELIIDENDRSGSKEPDPNYFNDTYFSGKDLNGNGGNSPDDGDIPGIEEANKVLVREEKPPIEVANLSKSGQSLAAAIGGMTPPPGASEQGLHGGTGVLPSNAPASKSKPQAAPANKTAAQAPVAERSNGSVPAPEAPEEDSDDRSLVQRVQDTIANGQHTGTIEYDGPVFGGWYTNDEFIWKGIDVVFPDENGNYMTFSEFLRRNIGKPIEDLKKQPCEAIYVIPRPGEGNLSKPVRDNDVALANAIIRNFWRIAEGCMKRIYAEHGLNPVNAVDSQKIVEDVQTTPNLAETKYAAPGETINGTTETNEVPVEAVEAASQAPAESSTSESSQSSATSEKAPAADVLASVADSAIADAEAASQSSANKEASTSEAPPKEAPKKHGVPRGHRR